MLQMSGLKKYSPKPNGWISDIEVEIIEETSKPT